VYLSGENNSTVTPLTAEDLVLPQGLTLTPILNGNNEPVDPSYYFVSVSDVGVFTVTYPNGSIQDLNSVHVHGMLPTYGLYTDLPASGDTLLPEGFTFDGTEQTLYLAAGMNTYIYSITPDVGGVEILNISQDKTSVQLKLTKDFSAERVQFRMSGTYLTFKDGKPTEAAYTDRNYGWSVNNLTPTLVWRSARWDPQTRKYISDPSSALNKSDSNQFNPNSNLTAEFFYDDRSGELQKLSLSDLTVSGNVLSATQDGEFIRLTFSGFGTGKVTYNGKSRLFNSTLPWFGFYSAPQATEENYLKEWKLTGSDNVIYGMFRPGSGQDLSQIARITESGGNGATFTVSQDKSYVEIHLSEPTSNWLSLQFYDASDRVVTYQSIQLVDERPGLYFCYPNWENGSLIPSTNPTNLRKNAITSCPGCSSTLEFFWRGENGSLTRLKASDLTASGNAFSLEDREDFVTIHFDSFGEGVITCQGSSVPVKAVVPGTGFFSAPEASEETYLQAFEQYRGEARTVYYTTSSPGDLVIDTIEHCDDGIVATITENGKFIKVDPAEGTNYGSYTVTFSGESQKMG
jgi:hypothetical protein